MNDKLPDDNPKTRYGVKKPPVHLVPPVAVLEEAMVFQLGAHKYGPYNWREKSISSSVYVSAAIRHIQSWQDGQDLDDESTYSHLAHARACLAILLDALHLDKLNDDRPAVPGKAAQFIKEVADEHG